MAIYLDDEAVDLPGEDLGALLAAARQRLEAAGRVVVEVSMDGQTLDAAALEQQDQLPVPADCEVRLYTAAPGPLAAQTLEQARAALAHAGDLQEEAADLLQADASNDALGKLGEAVEIWLQVQQAVFNAAMLVGVKLDELHVDDEPLASFAEELIAKLNDLKGGIEQQDTVRLADALGYEWPTIIERWDRLIGALIARVGEG